MVCVCQKTYDGSKSDYCSVTNLNGIKEFIIILTYNIIMSNITDRQTFVFSISLFGFTTAGGVENRAEVQIPLNLRFAADELVVKSSITTQHLDHQTCLMWCKYGVKSQMTIS